MRDSLLMKGELARAGVVAMSDLGYSFSERLCATSPSRSGRDLSWPRSSDVRAYRHRLGRTSNGRLLDPGDRGRWSTFVCITSDPLAGGARPIAESMRQPTSESREGPILTRQRGPGLAHVDFLNLRSRLALALGPDSMPDEAPRCRSHSWRPRRGRRSGH